MNAEITKESTHAEVREHWAKALESGEYAPYDWERDRARDDLQTDVDVWERYADTSWSSTLLDIRELPQTSERP